MAQKHAKSSTIKLEKTKILICGPESSGKTTLASDLCNLLDCTLIPEYAREYLNEFGANYIEADLLKIAQTHFNNYTKIIEEKNSEPIILDTFLLNIKIWSEIKYKQCHPWVITTLNDLSFDFIFLMRPNMPWENDPLRESKNERDLLFEIYKKELKQRNWKYHIIDEYPNKRTHQAHEILKRGTTHQP